MLKKPELLVTAEQVNDVERLISAGADAVCIGHQRYGLRVAGDFSIREIEQAVSIAKQRGAKVYVAVNAIFHHDVLATLPDFIQQLIACDVDALIFGDPAVLMTVREMGAKIKLHWNTETTATNHETVSFWGRKGAHRAILARELSLDRVLETKKNVSIEVEVQVHGMTCIFQSKRQLVSNYLAYVGSEAETSLNGRLALRQSQEEDTHYPIYEDVNGTHIMSNEDVCMIEHLDALIQGGVDSLRIEGLLKRLEYQEQVVRLYRQAIDVYVEDPAAYQSLRSEWKEAIRRIQPRNRKLSTGFYFKEQIY